MSLRISRKGIYIPLALTEPGVGADRYGRKDNGDNTRNLRELSGRFQPVHNRYEFALDLQLDCAF